MEGGRGYREGGREEGREDGEGRRGTEGGGMEGGREGEGGRGVSECTSERAETLTHLCFHSSGVLMTCCQS